MVQVMLLLACGDVFARTITSPTSIIPTVGLQQLQVTSGANQSLLGD